MDNIQYETNIFTIKNEENAELRSEDEKSQTEEMEEEENWEQCRQEKWECVEEAAGENARSNLEILVSQNDILPLLKKINREAGKSGGKVSLYRYAQEHMNQKKNGQTSTRNARLLNKNEENEQIISDSEDEIEFIKLESQPENLKNGQLKEYQIEALNWLLKLHFMSVNGILADEMGLGKTIQTISLLAYLNLQNKNIFHLIIVPKVTIKNWQREINKWLPDLRVLFFYGNKDERKFLTDEALKQKEYDVILTTFECSMKEKTALAKIHYEYLIIDEAHRIKNEKAKFSTIVRQFKSNHRLLLTGTPLQNNLHELWALLNFLMPNIFHDSQEFDKIFNLNSASQEDQLKIVKQIHHLLRPFVLRRLKSEVEFKLPSKKEIYLYVGLSELQKEMYKKILTKNIDVVNGVTKDKIQLQNILMQLKKVCNHPYLFPKVEKGPPYIEGEHLIYNSKKLKVLDVLLKKIYHEKGKVLIFSQMTTLLNILDDYCRYRGFRYCRIDGSTSSEDRDYRIEDFQSPTSDKFLFLISTRAGGLGINLHAANVVILYDSDWNPQVDLQAIDRAHRIGQTRPVTVYRFVTEGTVEEKIVERAAKKLEIDHLIIQRGKTVQNKINALELTNILQYGADKLFTTSEEEEEKNIEDILEYSISKTDQINSHLKDLKEKLIVNSLSLSSDKNDIYQFEGEDYKKKYNEESSTSNTFVNLTFAIGQRERKLINSNLEDKNKKLEYKKPKAPTGWRAKAAGGYIHQFYDRATLDYLDEKESAWKEYLSKKEDGTLDATMNEIPEEFTKEDEEYRISLIQQGFYKWTKKDFTKFLRASELVGLNDHEAISRMMKSKSPEDVEEYVKVFKQRIDEFPNGQRILAKINKFETEQSRMIEFQTILDELFAEIGDLYEDIYANLHIPYKTIKGKPANDNFDEDEDKYLICLMFKYGYRNWNPIKNHILSDPLMKFNLNMKLKTDQELLERTNYLINCFKNEKKKKKPTKVEQKNGKKSKSKKKLKKKKQIKRK